jgi:hypothetical protein
LIALVELGEIFLQYLNQSELRTAKFSRKGAKAQNFVDKKQSTAIKIQSKNSFTLKK